MFKFLCACSLALGLSGWAASLQAAGSNQPSGSLATSYYQGTVQDGAKRIASITLMFELETLRFWGGTVSSRGFSSGVQATETGELIIDALPLIDPSRPEMQQDLPKATLRFDPNGKPGKDARKLFGTIKTEQGQVFKFEVQMPEYVVPGRERMQP